VVKTPYGFHIIRVEDVKEAYTKTFEEVKASLEKELRQEEAKRLRAMKQTALLTGCLKVKT